VVVWWCGVVAVVVVVIVRGRVCVLFVGALHLRDRLVAKVWWRCCCGGGGGVVTVWGRVCVLFVGAWLGAVAPARSAGCQDVVVGE
jgi:hypothetical protein